MSINAYKSINKSLILVTVCIYIVSLRGSSIADSTMHFKHAGKLPIDFNLSRYCVIIVEIMFTLKGSMGNGKLKVPESEFDSNIRVFHACTFEPF